MADAPYSDVCHRWNWFRRSQWWPSFRERMLASKGGSCGAVLKVLGSPAGKVVLDATCGLGRKTLVMSHLGVNVVGSDASAYAVERARELAASEGREIEFFVSGWGSLPSRTPRRFDAVFVDAFMDCCESYGDVASSFAGIAACLNPGGLFTYPGPEPDERMTDLLAQAWKACERFYVDWRYAEQDRECTCVHAREKGPDFIDEHDLFVIREGGSAPRLEAATIRRWFRWGRRCLDDAARSAGFSRIHTESFDGYGFGRTTFTRIVARK
ncbi:MAG: class I SAM-dependent methyltransferase [Planctomycetes bacterium]|nr:class I SAM-dependent methyltransferase [Planctomycetota bacterium]